MAKLINFVDKISIDKKSVFSLPGVYLIITSPLTIKLHSALLTIMLEILMIQ